MVWKTRISIHPSCQEILLKGIRRETSIICIKNLLHISCNRKNLWFSWIYYWAACAPSHKMGFRSSAAKNGLPGEGRHEGLVPRNDVLTNGFIRFSLARTLVPRLRPPWKTHEALRTWRRLFALFEAIRSSESLYNFIIVRV